MPKENIMKCKYYAKVGPISRLRYCMLLLPEICTWHHCEALTFCICNKHRRLHADEVDPVRLEDL